ncbi:MAG: class I SAM-dependent methyltransferase [Cyanobacteria bacterium J06635_10]
MKTQINLGTIQETLLIPLLARARELEQAEPIVTDPKSLEIIQKLDYDFEKFSTSNNSLIGSCLRGMIIDNWVSNFLQQHPQGTVIEIGAGLNTRFERLDNGKLRWFDLDLPDVIHLRQKFFAETSRRQFISASVLDNDWIERVKETSTPPYMLVAEGVLMYLSEQQVKQLFDKLIENFYDSQFAFDSISPLMVKNQQYHDSIKHMSANFDWSISDISEIQNWNSGLMAIEIVTFANLEAKFLRRFSLINRLLFKYIPLLRNTYRLALFQLT